MNIIDILVRHVKDMEYDNIPGEVRHVGKLFIMDLIGVAIAGSSAPGCRPVVEQLGRWGGKPDCTVIGYGIKLPSIHAAFSNSTFAHALDYDDTHYPAELHATASIIPSTLAIAEDMGSVSGKDFITGIVLGVDVAARLSLSLKSAMHPGWVPASIFGGFGAVASMAKILDLDETQISNAFGIFYSQASGNRQALLDGALSKRMQPAFAAMQAVYAVSFAKCGISGARNIIHGKYGMSQLYAGGSFNESAIIDGLGKRFEITNLSFKFYPCARGVHPSIDGIFRILNRSEIDPEMIDEIEIEVPPFTYDLVGSPFVIRKNPQVDAQFSIPYAVATAILTGDVGLDAFREETVVSSSNVHQLAAKIKAVPDNKLNKYDPDSPLAIVHVHCKGGVDFTERVRIVKGDPDDPLSVEECMEKFRKCLHFNREVRIEKSADKLLDLILNMERLAEIREITAYL